MKKNQDILDDNSVDEQFERVNTPKSAKGKKKGNGNVLKTIRLIQITALILATLLLARQNFVYSIGLSVAVAISTAELIYKIVYKS